ncbi:hypothetical protein [Bdellovibrio sp. HCB337]|uniref:hypothetical protein n=1 Tax=Bdellovibrio sp. HCB337 TaxID=3394358 RepID=UPI0039A771CB
MKVFILLVSLFASTVSFASQARLMDLVVSASNEFKASYDCSLAGSPEQAEDFCVGASMRDAYYTCLQQRCEHCAIKSIQSKTIYKGEYKTYAEATVVLQGLRCK